MATLAMLAAILASGIGLYLAAEAAESEELLPHPETVAMAEVPRAAQQGHFKQQRLVFQLAHQAGDRLVRRVYRMNGEVLLVLLPPPPLCKMREVRFMEVLVVEQEGQLVVQMSSLKVVKAVKQVHMTLEAAVQRVRLEAMDRLVLGRLTLIAEVVAEVDQLLQPGRWVTAARAVVVAEAEAVAQERTPLLILAQAETAATAW